MQTSTILKLSQIIKTAVAADEFYTQVTLNDYGPFDGGCLIVATALNHILKLPYGGGFKAGNPSAQHSTLYTNGCFIDGNGAATQTQIQTYWQKAEGQKLYFRLCSLDELEDCFWNEAAHQRCVNYLVPLLTGLTRAQRLKSF